MASSFTKLPTNTTTVLAVSLTESDEPEKHTLNKKKTLVMRANDLLAWYSLLAELRVQRNCFVVTE